MAGITLLLLVYKQKKLPVKLCADYRFKQHLRKLLEKAFVDLHVN